MSADPKPAVTLVTLESYNHNIDAIEHGVKLYQQDGIEYKEDDPNRWVAQVPHQNGLKRVTLSFSRDGQELQRYCCSCTEEYENPPVCCHVVAAVLAIQGGIIPTRLALGQAAKAQTTVTQQNTAKAVGSGQLEVFATPMMIALMEQAACLCLADILDPGQTSVGTKIDVEHTAASPLGATIRATATIAAVTGRKINFTVEAYEGERIIGKGTHTRVIVDAARFMAKLGRS